MTTWESHVLPHGPVEKLSENLWTVAGTLRSGPPLPRYMAIYRMGDGGLLLHSPVALNDAGMRELEALGAVKFILVPNKMHRLDAGVYKERYPQARVICPAVAKGAVEKVVPVDATCEATLPNHGVTCHRIPGLRPFELAYELPLNKGNALVVCDALFNLKHMPGAKGLILRLIGSTGFFGISRIGRLFMLKDKALFRGWLQELAKRSDLSALSMAHGVPLVKDLSGRLTEAARRVS